MRAICQFVTGLLVALYWSTSLASADSRPNIILILADDLGIENLGVYGGESYHTPNLDQLARDGLRFENAHANPLCTPSRVKLMTGKYNFRNYQDFMVLPRGETTFGHVLRDGGYRTMVAGKWQLHSSGFEAQTGSLPEEAGFEDYRLWQVTREGRGSRYWGPKLVTNGKTEQFPADRFGPDLINDYVLRYIDEHQQEPFFIYYPMLLPHDPFVATPDAPEAESDEARYAAMMAYMDKLVGKVRSKLETLGIADNTLLLFIGDNGTSYRISSVRHGVTVAGGKGSTTDSGTHVPFIAWWQGTVTSARVDHSLVNLNDFFPTLLDVAGLEPPAGMTLDGKSLLPVLKGNDSLERSTIFVHYEPKAYLFRSARYAFDNEWKLYDDGRFYHTAADPEEEHNLERADLDAVASAARERLRRRLEKMEGDSVSGFYSLPGKMTARLQLLAGCGALLIAATVAWRRRRLAALAQQRSIPEA